MISQSVLLTIVLAPLLAAILAGLAGKVIGRAGAHTVTIAGVAIAFGLSAYVLKLLLVDGAPIVNQTVYTWLVSDGIRMEVGFLVDNLSAMMMTVVTFVSLCVHVYTIGYMKEDPGYQRFFAYISLFTFSMLMLVMSNNFMQLFFGWEAVGVVSYLLIGFWYTRPSAIFANLKAFLVNRVGDFGFVLGIAGVAYYTGSLDYATVFDARDAIVANTMEIFPGVEWQAITVVCICLFVGAMGKSAQVPLHVWLPDSMEGPTPISALIHAATMVTAGIFMVARMSPLFELSEVALSTVLVIGATTAFFMGLLGLVNNDIKRVVAYSTLSQLGYMTVALGVSAYAGALFHLMTHAFFKALLFLAAGSVIIGMHHEQDMRKMGGLKKYMPITYWTSAIGTLALIGFPGTSGFFSKDALIEAVHASHIPGATYAYWCVFLGVFITAFYSFRLVFMTFHGPERFREVSHESHGESNSTHLTSDADAGHEPDTHADHGAAAHGHHAPAGAHAVAHDDHGHHGPVEPHESPWVVTLPLILLAIPSLFIGAVTIGPMLFGDFFNGVLFVNEEHNVLGHIGEEWHGPLGFILHAFQQPAIYLAFAGWAAAWFLYIKRPDLPAVIAGKFSALYHLFAKKFYFDEIYQAVFARGSVGLGTALWRVGDVALIDGAAVNGSARAVGWLSGVMRRLQSGYLYHYAFAMIIGLSVLLAWYVLR
ncbi:NADH dehydrogenase subunit L [Steroidobacter agaridevorans]|uniref:NADH dehydrogenase subunit L n=1 Tax=Steroidobacter agaridevorans TaxID=2695856 RepID=A0A829YNM3_9GAMM|nr:NADH-quinone oxidoreductase subunit L [Steroidobacter agaridevorans]GFE84850.1 NADH dehydrogenase subunit L [Steroidobacter agaridevorans]GFE91869.1 NADH dehydrogenase subunit L [Steroidobacter agaridevorans]